MSTQFANGKIVTSGLVLALDAADRNSYPSSGNTWFDVSGNANNGTLTNGPTFNSANGGSIVFDGVDDFAITSNNTSSYYVSSSFTISTWANVSSTNTGFRGIFGCFDDNSPSSTNYTGYSFWIRPGESKFNFLIGSGGGFTFIPADSNYQNDVWYNLTGINTGGVSYFYINGILQNTTSNQNIALPQHPVKIGRTYRNINGYYYSGKVANGIIYTKTLSSEEVLQNYNAQKSRFNL